MSEQGSHEIRLLILDDDMALRRTMEAELTGRGFRVVTIDSDEEALARIQQAPPDVVLLVMGRSETDSFETLENIRELAQAMPVILLSGDPQLKDVIRGIRLRIVDFLEQPVDLDHLSAVIRAAVSGTAPPALREPSIRELMIPVTSYLRIFDDQPLREAVELLRRSFVKEVVGKAQEQGHRSILVFDRRERFVGCMRLGDLLSLLLPDYVKDPNFATHLTGMYLAQCKMVANQSVRTALGPQCTVDIHAPLYEALYLMVTNQLINLPVLDQGQIVGVLRDKDFLLDMAEHVVWD
jgi:CheY-like chemotaxis protein